MCILLALIILICGQQLLESRHHHYGHSHSQRDNTWPTFNMPLFPKLLPKVELFNTTTKKFIPQKLWIAVKDRHDEMPGHWKEFFQRNSDWEVHICDNSCKNEFMEFYFHDTSILWAYNKINPLVGAARADIWRYAVLYTWGGVYIDDDSDIKTALDQVVSSTDRLIMSEEGSSSLGDCYIPTYHLSEIAAFHKYPNYTKALHFHGMNKENQPIFFHGNTLINWAIFTMPRHPLFERTLKNIVEIVESEYMRQSYVHMTRWDVRWKQVMCTTGFVLTYTVRELELENAISAELFPRISTNNFREYKGNVKAIWTGGDPNHYMKAMQRKNGPHILKELVPLNVTSVIKFLHHRTVMGDSGKEIYLIYNGRKYTFGGYDIFLGMNFTDAQTRHVNDEVLMQIPSGGQISSIEGFDKQQKQNALAAESGIAALSEAAKTAIPELKKFLKIASRTINNMSVSCFGDDYGGTRDDFLKDQWKSVLGDIPVMVYPFCLRTFQLGNTLGYYLNDIACADVSGSHFVAVHKDFNILDPDSLAAKGRDRHAFFEHLPDLIINNDPKPAPEVKVLMKKKCDCLQFCWENAAAPWLQRIPIIGNILLPAIDGYARAAHADHIGTVLNNKTDLSTIPSALNGDLSVPSPLPFIPNVTIQYRCGDNIGFGKTKYGLLPFKAYNRQRIPEDLAQYIYVIADSPSRQPTNVYSSRCETILLHLFQYLTKTFPRAHVVVKRGGDAFLDYSRIAHSKVVFCSASTFCLWPALSNRMGTVYFPKTPLVGGNSFWVNNTAPKLAHNFFWIEEVEMIKQFKHYRPWSRVIDDLEAA